MINDLLGALGSWDVQLMDGCPDEVLNKLGYFGHIAFVRGWVDVISTGDNILNQARYVGVLRSREMHNATILSGASMALWLGDEDHKGQVLETPVVLTNATFTDAITAVLPDAIRVGTIHAQSGTYTGTHQWESPRDALDTICAAFNAEWRVNGNGLLDAGTTAQLYNVVPDSIIVRKGAGVDMDMVALGGDFDVTRDVVDYSTRVVLLGQTQDNGQILESTANVASVPYKDMFGNPVKRTRMVSDTSQTSGSVTASAQLQLNRFSGLRNALKVTADQYETNGNFNVGDMTYIFDPASGLYNTSNQVVFRGDVLHPDTLRIAGMQYPVTDEHTVAFRTQDGEWIDLTHWVIWETGTDQVTVGELPRSLTSSPNVVQQRQDQGKTDSVAPGLPLNLVVTSEAVTDSIGNTTAVINANWDPPVQNADGSTITDLDHYILTWIATDDNNWVQYYETIAPQAQVPALANRNYTVHVAAVDTSGNVGNYTADVTLHTAADDTPPSAPTNPIVTNYLGQLRIEWDGHFADGNPPPPDFNRVDVHIYDQDNFIPAVGVTLVGSLMRSGVVYATAPYGQVRYVRLVAVDRSGNWSAPTPTVTGATGQVVSADVFDGAIGSAKLADLAVITAKIDNLAVNSAQVGAIDVGKLTAGTITADVVMGGRFATSLTGQRVELNAAGLFQYDGANNPIVQLGSGTVLLTGTYQTALSGNRRITMGSGTNFQVLFFENASGYHSYLRGLAESGTGYEALQLGVGEPDTANLSNRLHMNSQGYTSLKSTRQEFYYDDYFAIYDASADFSTSRQTYLSQNGQHTFWDASSKQAVTITNTGETIFSPNSDTTHGRLIVRTNIGIVGQSARLQYMNDAGFGLMTKMYLSGAANDPLRFEVRNINDDNFEGIYAAFFTQISDERTKDSIRVLDIHAEDMLSKVMGNKVHRYRVKRSDDLVMPDEIGFIAQRAPDEIVRGRGTDVEAIDLYQSHALLTAAFQQFVETTTNELQALKNKDKK